MILRNYSLYAFLLVSSYAFGQNSDSTKQASNSTEIFSYVEEQASYPGGIVAFYEHQKLNLRYPLDAQKKGIEGRVFVQFIVEQDGSLSNMEVVRGVHPSLDEEAVRVFRISGKWIPGKIKERPVRQKMIQNITFKLAGSTKSGNSQSSKPPLYKEARPFGGSAGLKNYLQENIKEINAPLPPNETLNKVHLKITIDTSGLVSNVEIQRSLGKERDAEAKRLFMEMPAWQPAELNGKSVRRSYNYYVNFNTIPEKDITAGIRLYRSAIENYNKGRLEKAYAYFNKAIDKNPTSLNFYFDRAALLIKMEDNLAACKDLQYIKDYDPQALSLYQQICGKKE